MNKVSNRVVTGMSNARRATVNNVLPNFFGFGGDNLVSAFRRYSGV